MAKWYEDLTWFNKHSYCSVLQTELEKRSKLQHGEVLLQLRVNVQNKMYPQLTHAQIWP